MIQWILNNLQLLIIVAVAGFSVLSWVARRLAEKAEERRQLHERERRRLEALRTGRVEPQDEPAGAPTAPVAVTPEQRLAEIARRREEMRRRMEQAAARAQAPTQGPMSSPGQSMPSSTRSMPVPSAGGGPTQMRVPAAGGGPTQMRVPAAGGGPTQMPVPTRPTNAQNRAQARLEEIQARRRAEIARQQQAQRRTTQPKPSQRPRPEAERPASLENAESSGGIELSDVFDVHEHMAEDNRRAFETKRVRTFTRQTLDLDTNSLRQAIILTELLGPPVALRNEEGV